MIKAHQFKRIRMIQVITDYLIDDLIILINTFLLSLKTYFKVPVQLYAPIESPIPYFIDYSKFRKNHPVIYFVISTIESFVNGLYNKVYNDYAKKFINRRKISRF